MLKISTFIPDYEVHEYLLVLSPTGAACQQIWSVKHDLRRTVNAPFAICTGPHLTMVVFLAYAKTEEKIIDRLHTIGLGITPFNVALQNFGGFDQSRTLYIHVATKDAILNVLEELKQARYLLKLNVGYAPRFIIYPHVSICRGMEPWQYAIGRSVYSNLSFSENFIADSMTLLKRKPGSVGCKVIGQFPFLSTPSLLKQGVLFG